MLGIFSGVEIHLFNSVAKIYRITEGLPFFLHYFKTSAKKRENHPKELFFNTKNSATRSKK
ncbi:MAG: hypothetical protein EA358_08480 [Flavobacteriales bacterium]|nr:MAG: hypothetical protein EA358_08480 [Flavobacteriales bacterium]